MLQRLRAAKDEQGFTLVELLIVIIILGVLAGVVVFAVSGVSDRGTESACKAEAQTIVSAQQANFSKNNSYASNVAALRTNGFLATTPSYFETSTANNGAPILLDAAAYRTRAGLPNTSTATNPCVGVTL